MANKEATAYIGTYTKAESQGIYRLVVDTSTGEIKENKLAGKVNNPTYLKISNDEKLVFSVAKDNDNGGVASFSIQEDGTLQFINQVLGAGSPPCYVDLSDDNQRLVSANYHLGTIVSYPVSDDGTIQTETSVVQHKGSSVHERQEKPHAHFAGYSPDGKHVITCDLGTDRVTTYSIKDGKLVEVSELAVTPGSGPRHLDFHPNKKFVYIMTELTAEVIAAEYNADTGSIIAFQTVASLPEDFTGANTGSAIHVSPNGKFLYVSNRGHDSITSFSIDPDSGKLTKIETVSVEGKGPRDFDLNFTGEILLAANENTNNVTVFQVNQETGALKLLQKEVKVPEPVCVKFLK